jgi:hypothetical protein
MDRINNFTSTDTGTRLYGNATIEDIFCKENYCILLVVVNIATHILRSLETKGLI